MSKDKDTVDPSSPLSLRSLGDDPSVRELEALEQQDRKETAELLSGFDRPARTPRTPRARDFVDYYSSPSGKSAPMPPRSSSRREETSPHEKRTVIVPRREGVRATVRWALAVLGMILFGATIAVLATPPSPPAPQAVRVLPTTMPPVAPTSATTITSANPQTVEETTTDTVITAAPPTQPPKKGAPSTTVTNGATTAPTIKTAPRDDFIRDM